MKTQLFLSLTCLWSSFPPNRLPFVIACEDVVPSVTTSPPDGLITFNDVDRIGGLDEMDKILQIEVFANDGLLQFISQIQTTYLRTDGQTAVISNGNKGTLVGKVEFDPGQYLSQVELSVGLCVEHIRFCRTDGSCLGPFGYHTEKAPNRILYKPRSVIKAFLGQAGKLIDRLGVYFETDKIFKTELGKLSYQNISTPAIVSDLTFESPKAKVTVDNQGSSVEQSTTVSFTETVSTSETTVVTKSKQVFGSISLSATPGLLYEATVADVSASFTLGTSFSVELSESNTREFQTVISSEYKVNAPPYSLVTGQAYWRQIKYSYHWEAPVHCFFNFDPSNAVSGGTIEGDLYGSQAFPQSYVKFTQTVTTASPQATGVPPPVLPPLVSPPVADTMPPVSPPIPKVRTASPSVAPTEKIETLLPTAAPTKKKKAVTTKMPSPAPSPFVLTDMPSPAPTASVATDVPSSPPLASTDMPSSPPFPGPGNGKSGEKDDNLGIASGSFAMGCSACWTIVVVPAFGVFL
jgi:Jacalin-like lectin domain